MASSVFISYRREDAEGEAGRLRDRLVGRIGSKNVFWDRHDLAPGDDYIDRIAERMAEVDVVLAVVGPRWASQSNLERLQNPDDWVRRELEVAIRSASTKVAAVTVDGAAWPPAGELPDSLQPMRNIQAGSIRSDQFDHDCDVLFDRLNLRNRRRRRVAILVLGALFAIAAVAVGFALAPDPKPTAGGFETTTARGSGLTTTSSPDSDEDPPTTTSIPPSFLEQMSGTWTLIDWRERSEFPVTLGMDVLEGTLTVDTIGHAFWDLDLDDGGPPPTFTPGVRCMGVVSPVAEELEGVPGRLSVNGEDLIGEQRDWTGNLTSLRGDVGVAFCGWTFEPETNLFVFDTTNSIYSLDLSSAADAAQTLLLEMMNEAGTFIWQKDG